MDLCEKKKIPTMPKQSRFDWDFFAVSDIEAELSRPQAKYRNVSDTQSRQLLFVKKSHK